LSCAQLDGMKVPATSIGLPTTGAVVTAAAPVAASGSGAQATGSYCKVTGNINPVDPRAPAVEFQIDMPDTWNSKVMMFGGCGYDGTIPAAGGNVPIGPTNRPTSLGRGYAVFGSDSGIRPTHWEARTVLWERTTKRCRILRATR
jgi:Tannase and feruloyl esterase